MVISWGADTSWYGKGRAGGSERFAIKGCGLRITMWNHWLARSVFVKTLKTQLSFHPCVFLLLLCPTTWNLGSRCALNKFLSIHIWTMYSIIFAFTGFGGIQCLWMTLQLMHLISYENIFHSIVFILLDIFSSFLSLPA